MGSGSMGSGFRALKAREESIGFLNHLSKACTVRRVRLRVARGAFVIAVGLFALVNNFKLFIKFVV